MSRGKALVLAVFTLWPLLYFALFLGLFAIMLFSFAPGVGPAMMPDLMRILFPLHLFTILETFVLLAIYIVHVFRSERLPQDQKVLWLLVLFFANSLAMPVYWYLHMWSARAEEQPDDGVL